MPVKPENAKRYPANWKELRAKVLKRADNKCEKCGVANYSIVERAKGFVRIVLTIAHLEHDELETQDIRRLRALCQKCHLTMDAKLGAQNARITRHKRKAIGELFDV